MAGRPIRADLPLANDLRRPFGSIDDVGDSDGTRHSTRLGQDFGFKISASVVAKRSNATMSR